MRVFLLSTARLALLCIPGLAFAADYPKVIRTFVDRGVKVEKDFAAASGLTGWVLSNDAGYSIVFTSADGKTLIVGDLLDENGASLMKEYADKYFPRTALQPLFNELEQRVYVAEGALGEAKSILYVFLDTNCPYCHLTWKMLQAYEKAGLQVRWVLVAYLAPTSLPKAVSILEAADRTATLRKVMQEFGRDRGGVVNITAKVKPEIAATLQKNLELMQRFGIKGTPGLVWKDRDGRIAVKAGMPRLSELPRITGLPEQGIDDPELARLR